MKQPKARLEVSARSETGYVRNENQDRMSGTVVPAGNLYIVADGMGGHKGGALAAELTIERLRMHIGEAPADAPVEDSIRNAFAKANEAVYKKGHSGDKTIEDMGSTAVLLLVSGEVARVAHVGDSRAYLFRNGLLSQLTTDHTRVQRMVEAGMLRAEEAADHPDSNILERAIGNRPEVDVDISGELPLEVGDAFLLCSDGLSSYVPGPEIEAVLKSSAAVQEIPQFLVKLALEKGGKDNITVQYIRYGERIEKRSNNRKTKVNKVDGPILFSALFVFAGLLSVIAYLGYLHWKGNNPVNTTKMKSAAGTAKQMKDAALSRTTSAAQRNYTTNRSVKALPETVIGVKKHPGPRKPASVPVGQRRVQARTHSITAETPAKPPVIVKQPETVKSAVPVKPAETMNPADNAKPVEAGKPVEAAKPAEPAKQPVQTPPGSPGGSTPQGN